MTKRLVSILFIVFVFCSQMVMGQSENENLKWLYLGADVEHSQYYLKGKAKKVENGQLEGWIKIVFDDLSYSIQLERWDCQEKRNNVLHISSYRKDGKLIYSGKERAGWKIIVPDSMKETVLFHVCGIKKPVFWAEITSRKANMRVWAGKLNMVLRIANKGERFRIVQVLKDKSWYNVVDDKTDEKTQQNYWVHRSTIKVVKEK